MQVFSLGAQFSAQFSSRAEDYSGALFTCCTRTKVQKLVQQHARFVRLCSLLAYAGVCWRMLAYAMLAYKYKNLRRSMCVLSGCAACCQTYLPQGADAGDVC